MHMLSRKPYSNESSSPIQWFSPVVQSSEFRHPENCALSRTVIHWLSYSEQQSQWMNSLQGLMGHSGRIPLEGGGDMRESHDWTELIELVYLIYSASFPLITQLLLITLRGMCSRGKVIMLGVHVCTYILLITWASVKYGEIFHEPKASEIGRGISHLTSVKVHGLFIRSRPQLLPLVTHILGLNLHSFCPSWPVIGECIEYTIKLQFIWTLFCDQSDLFEQIASSEVLFSLGYLVFHIWSAADDNPCTCIWTGAVWLC